MRFFSFRFLVQVHYWFQSVPCIISVLEMWIWSFLVHVSVTWKECVFWCLQMWMSVKSGWSTVSSVWFYSCSACWLQRSPVMTVDLTIFCVILSVFASHLLTFLTRCITIKNCYVFFRNWHVTECFSLSLIIFLVLKSALFGTNIASPAFFWLVLA